MLPPPPAGLRALESADLRVRPATAARWGLLLHALLLLALAARALPRWGGQLPAVAGLLAALTGWCAVAVAHLLSCRRDLPLRATLAAVEAAETDRGRLTWLTLDGVGGRAGRLEVEANWAQAAAVGDEVAVRWRETALGTCQVLLGAPGPQGWQLPPPRAGRKLLVRAYKLLGAATLAALAALAGAPQQRLAGEVRQVVQEAWQTGDGRLPWQVQVSYAGGELAARVTHDELLALLPAAGRRALATPGLLAPEERRAAEARWLPLGRAVWVRQTRLGPWRATFLAGDAEEP
ncbi:MAG: hypothetical protein IT204_23780 [Fimbriimonadaceae bacterium]|nr:hypothetical protein [Fimbriimonadaceae bacterium]